MATQTTNYGLTKPSYNETADIGVINSNMDIIDAKMKAIENKAGSGGGGGNTDTYGHVKVGSVTIDASGDDTIELVAGSNVTLTPDTTSKSVTISATGGGGGTSVTIDSELSTTSENPVQNKVITQALNEKGTYSKPTGGIPKTDLASEVQTSLGKADTALQEHQDISGKADKTDVTALSNTISDAWNASTTYAVGQYCIYNNSLWKCLVQHNGQTPTEGTYWEEVRLSSVVSDLSNSLSNKTDIKLIGFTYSDNAIDYYADSSSEYKTQIFKVGNILIIRLMIKILDTTKDANNWINLGTINANCYNYRSVAMNTLKNIAVGIRVEDNYLFVNPNNVEVNDLIFGQIVVISRDGTISN